LIVSFIEGIYTPHDEVSPTRLTCDCIYVSIHVRPFKYKRVLTYEEYSIQRKERSS